MINKGRTFSEVGNENFAKGHAFENMVYKTDNHDIFRLSKFNRNVLLRDEMLKQAEEGFIAPIIVNENMIVIDGQHRLEASKKVGVPVEYIIKPGLDKRDIVRMNTVQKPWSLLNYIESYANEGKEEYVRLVNLIKENYSNVTVVSSIAVHAASDNTRAADLIKSGNFRFYNYEKAVEILQYYKRFREETNTPKRTTVATALYTLFQYKKFNKNRMIEKTIATDLNEEIKVKTYHHTDILKTLLDAYNTNLGVNSKGYINYLITSSGHLVIHEEKKEWAEISTKHKEKHDA